MSRAEALIHFNDGTVLRGCYDGTCDFLSRRMITTEELQKRYQGRIFLWNDEDLDSYPDLDSITDSEPCEIYVDYGYGSIWHNCKGSRSAMIITSNIECDYTDPELDIDHDHIPKWVYDAFIRFGWNTSYIEDRVNMED